MPASKRDGTERIGRTGELINEGAVTPTHAGRKGETLQRLPSRELSKVKIELETQLLDKGAALLQPARDNASGRRKRSILFVERQHTTQGFGLKGGSPAL